MRRFDRSSGCQPGQIDLRPPVNPAK
jgi:hypothetical protein